MKLGLQLYLDYPNADSETWSKISAQATTAEESGFDGLFIPTEIGWRRLDPLSLLAALASVTTRVTIGTNILTLPLYAPLHVAEALATSDLISEGRTVMGVASGWRSDEFAAAGVPFNQRLGRTYEALEIIHQLWTQPAVTYHGKYYDLDDVSLQMKPLQLPQPEVWLGAHSPKAIERAARTGITWVEGPRTALETWVTKKVNYERIARDAGYRIGGFPLMRDSFVAEKSGLARKFTEAALIDKYAEYARQAKLDVGPVGTLYDKLAPSRFIVGTVDECRERLSEYAAAGVTWLILRMQYPGSDDQRVLDSIRLFGQDVWPNNRRATAP
jgi:alkanesulfonate monooxygenase SsuD/methylene tetrahydromethanopterin reductase-like flavin-dependent oxidoreductase (luciferase family)